MRTELFSVLVMIIILIFSVLYNVYGSDDESEIEITIVEPPGGGGPGGGGPV